MMTSRPDTQPRRERAFSLEHKTARAYGSELWRRCRSFTAGNDLRGHPVRGLDEKSELRGFQLKKKHVISAFVFCCFSFLFCGEKQQKKQQNRKRVVFRESDRKEKPKAFPGWWRSTDPDPRACASRTFRSHDPRLRARVQTAHSARQHETARHKGWVMIDNVFFAFFFFF